MITFVAMVAGVVLAQGEPVSARGLFTEERPPVAASSADDREHVSAKTGFTKPLVGMAVAQAKVAEKPNAESKPIPTSPPIDANLPPAPPIPAEPKAIAKEGAKTDRSKAEPATKPKPPAPVQEPAKAPAAPSPPPPKLDASASLAPAASDFAPVLDPGARAFVTGQGQPRWYQLLDKPGLEGFGVPDASRNLEETYWRRSGSAVIYEGRAPDSFKVAPSAAVVTTVVAQPSLSTGAYAAPVASCDPSGCGQSVGLFGRWFGR